MKYKTLRQKYENLFIANGIDEFSDIDWIMVEITGRKRSMLPFYEFSCNEVDKIENAIKLRLSHIPLAYIFGKTYFYGREFKVNSSTLIPRMDTEVLVDNVIREIKGSSKSPSILDIGTGSGIIAITLKKETNSTVTAVDISKSAIEVARENAENLGAEITFIQSDLFQNLNGLKFDILVSNPPYIKTSVIKSLDKEVRLNEPLLALDGGENGLFFYQKILEEAKDYLNENGKVYFEIGYDQAGEVAKLMKKDFTNIKIIKDYEGNDRVILGKLRGDYDWEIKKN